jgi:hypothetical protein
MERRVKFAVVEKVCARCGVTFETSHGALYCSRACHSDRAAKRMRGDRRRAERAELPPLKPGTLARRWVSPPPGDEMALPIFESWDDFLARTTERERRIRCQQIAKGANRKRLMSAGVALKLNADDVWRVIERAKGRCIHCRSLCVENRPTGPGGKPLSWDHVGRRIGSLEHIISRYDGGGNEPENLGWACLWCNTWRAPDQRRPFSNDHGGYYPPEIVSEY